MPSVQPTTLNCLTSQVTHHTTSSSVPVFQLAHPHPVPMLHMYTWPATPLPSTLFPSLPTHLQLRKQCVRVQQSQFPPHTRPPHSWYLPPNSQNGRRGQARSVGHTVLMPIDLLGRHSDRQSPWGKQRGRKEYNGGFVMSRSSKVDPISCFS